MAQAVIIDDVDVSRYAISLILDEMEVTYNECRSNEEARKCLQSENPKVVFLDWHLRKESGLDLINEIKDLTNAKIYVISGVEGQDKSSQVTKAGADGFLVKPVDKESIQKCLSDAGC